jgi:aminopeptidase YwaD
VIYYIFEDWLILIFVQITFMYKWILFLLILPASINAQSKKKKLKLLMEADQKSAIVLVNNLQNHVQYLASDSLEGRRTGTKGETNAMNYIANQYATNGIEAKGTKGYFQSFEINEGKQIAFNTFLKINQVSAIVQTDFFPLANSKNGKVQGMPAIALNEANQPWFFDLKDALETNKSNPHFDIESFLKQQTTMVAKKGATALFIFNSSTITDNILFNKNDKSATTEIPLIFITAAGQKKFLKDMSATIEIELEVVIEEHKRTGKNVIAYIDNKATNTVIIGAHYDHLGFGEDKNALDTGHIIHNGADDNASGTAAVIELAKKLKQSGPKNNNYLFIHFSGEELGLFGSKYWIENPSIQITPNYMINMDMVGRYDTVHKLTIGGYGTSPVWGDIFSSNTNNKLIVKFDSTGSGPSDHATFYRANIPVLFLFTGSHPDYHKATDDWEKINYQALKNIVQYTYQIIESTDKKGKLIFTKTAEPQMGKSKFTVSLGIIPDYGYNGTGVRVDGISAGKLAEKIGLQTGDIILQIGEYKFVDVMSYMQTLSKFKKGDTTQLKIKRGDSEKQFDIIF